MLKALDMIRTDEVSDTYKSTKNFKTLRFVTCITDKQNFLVLFNYEI